MAAEASFAEIGVLLGGGGWCKWYMDMFGERREEAAWMTKMFVGLKLWDSEGAKSERRSCFIVRAAPCKYRVQADSWADVTVKVCGLGLFSRLRGGVVSWSNVRRR